MNINVDELRPVIDAWSWPSDPANQAALLALGFVFFAALVFLYIPLLSRGLQMARLDRRLRKLAERKEDSVSPTLDEWDRAFLESPVASQWTELKNHWRSSIELEASGKHTSLASVLDRWPLLPLGLRRRALESVPGLLMLLGLMGAVLSLSLAFPTSTPAEIGWASGIAPKILTAPLWGLSLALLANLVSRLFQGAFEHYSESLDRHTSAAFPDFCDEQRAGMQTTPTPVTPFLESEFHGDPELESTHLAHLQLNKVTRQLSSLIEHLHESGFALRNAASALRSTQGRIENNSEEIRISLKQAASAVVDQGGFIQMSLDQIRATLHKPELPVQSLQMPETSAPAKDVTRKPPKEVQADATPAGAGRRLGPDPYARMEDQEQRDAKAAQRLLERHEAETSSHSIGTTPSRRLPKDGPGKLSDLLAGTPEKKNEANPKPLRSVNQGEGFETGKKASLPEARQATASTPRPE